MNPDLLILGAGPAGFHAAKAACRLKTGIVLAGAEPYLPYWRPRLSEVIETGAQAESIQMSESGWFQRHGITYRLSRKAVSIDPARKTVRWDNGDTTAYGTLILSCGAAPAAPVLPFSQRVYTLRTYQDALEIRAECLARKKALIVGGGALGLETAFALTKLGCRVSVSVHSYLLSHQLDQEGGAFLKTLLEREGIAICSGDPANLKAEADGACVIAATGVRPSLELAKGCGIRINRGIVVDERMRTSVPGIYACGDIAEYQGAVPGLMAIAAKQGETAGTNAAGGDAVYQTVLPSPVTKVGGLSVLSIGSMKLSGDSQIYRRADGENYAAAVVTEGKITGAAFIGDIVPGMKLKSWMESGKKIGNVSSLEEIVSKVNQ